SLYCTLRTPHNISACFTRVYHQLLLFFFFNDTATTEIYTLSLHDALPISGHFGGPDLHRAERRRRCRQRERDRRRSICDCCGRRSEEHTSELQSRSDLVCRLLLEKKKKKK